MNKKNLYFSDPAHTKRMQPILVSCEAPFRNNLQKNKHSFHFAMRRPFNELESKHLLPDKTYSKANGYRAKEMRFNLQYNNSKSNSQYYH